MRAFAAWAKGFAGNGSEMLLVGLNVLFDWSFINYNFYRVTGSNPFGFAALDIKRST